MEDLETISCCQDAGQEVKVEPKQPHKQKPAGKLNFTAGALLTSPTVTQWLLLQVYVVLKSLCMKYEARVRCLAYSLAVRLGETVYQPLSKQHTLLLFKLLFIYSIYSAKSEERQFKGLYFPCFQSSCKLNVKNLYLMFWEINSIHHQDLDKKINTTVMCAQLVLIIIEYTLDQRW